MTDRLDPTNPPTAKIESTASDARRYLSPYWIVAIACLLGAVGLTGWAFREGGPKITVSFSHGHGIKPGDRLRHRGIEVGEVDEVQLLDDFSGIEAVIQLQANAAGLASEGSLFWIERPQIAPGRIRGLETVVGAKYVSVLPGPPGAPRKRAFRGEEYPLTIEGTQLREIVVRFRNGNGLTVGAPLRHRGIQVGEVVEIDLPADLAHVEVRVRLEGDATQLARGGSRFWVERPQLSFSGVRGLETVFGGRYLAVEPGPSTAPEVKLFDGLEAPPVARADGIEVVLESPERFGVEVGAPVTYRGMQVGTIVAVQLATDARHVETLIQVTDEYRPLVCKKTQFWSTGGIGISVGLSGVELNAQTLQTIAAGGVAFATPNNPGDQVSTGHRFSLAKKVNPVWVEWSPRLAAGPARLPDGTELPTPQTVVLSWRVRQLGWLRRRQRRGLVLRLSDGRWLGTHDLFYPPDDMVAGSAHLEIAGEQIALDPQLRETVGGAASYRIPLTTQPTTEPWPTKSIRRPQSTEPSLIVVGGAVRAIPLPIHRVTDDGESWSIDSSFAIAPEWHGASVVSAKDGKLVAVLEVNPQRGGARAMLLAGDGD